MKEKDGFVSPEAFHFGSGDNPNREFLLIGISLHLDLIASGVFYILLGASCVVPLFGRGCACELVATLTRRLVHGESSAAVA